MGIPFLCLCMKQYILWKTEQRGGCATSPATLHARVDQIQL